MKKVGKNISFSVSMNGMGKQKLFLVHFSHSKISMAHILNVWENNGEKSRPIHTQHKMIEY